MRKPFRLIGFIILASMVTSTLVTGCQPVEQPDAKVPAGPTDLKSADTPADELRLYAPAQAGATWKTEIVLTSQAGATPLTAITENLPSTRLKGENVEQQKVTFLGRPDLDVTRFWIVDRSAVTIIGSQRRGSEKTIFAADERQVLLKQPLEVGTKWTTVNRGLDGKPAPSTVEIVATGEAVTVPTGTYPGALKVKQTETVTIDSRTGISETYIWYVPNIGAVKADTTFRYPGKPVTTIRSLLEQYQP